MMSSPVELPSYTVSASSMHLFVDSTSNVISLCQTQDIEETETTKITKLTNWCQCFFVMFQLRVRIYYFIKAKNKAIFNDICLHLTKLTRWPSVLSFFIYLSFGKRLLPYTLVL